MTDRRQATTGLRCRGHVVVEKGIRIVRWLLYLSKRIRGNHKEVPVVEIVRTDNFPWVKRPQVKHSAEASFKDDKVRGRNCFFQNDGITSNGMSRTRRALRRFLLLDHIVSIDPRAYENWDGWRRRASSSSGLIS